MYGGHRSQAQGLDPKAEGGLETTTPDHDEPGPRRLSVERRRRFEEEKLAFPDGWVERADNAEDHTIGGQPQLPAIGCSRRSPLRNEGGKIETTGDLVDTLLPSSEVLPANPFHGP
jgi:hypothetical protein